VKHANIKNVAGIAAILLALQAPCAHADLEGRLQPLTVQQVGFEGLVRHGTVVEAHTNLNNLVVSGSYRGECSDYNIRPPLTGSRTLSSSAITGPSHLLVTVPRTLPAIEPLSGWDRVMGGARFDCTYTASGAARTAVLQIGTGGTGISLGGETWEESGTTTFSMVKPGTKFGGGCIL
jgi:hypothetical protein